MVKKKSVSFDDIGEIEFHSNPRARRLIIRYRPFEQVKVTIPGRMTFRDACKIIRENKAAILNGIKQKKYMEETIEKQVEKLPEMSIQAAREKIIRRFYALANRHNFTFNRISIRNQKTRWGSCSGKNNINLNIRLAYLPPHLMDYVILHELLHTRIKNHSAAFWEALDAILPGAQGFRSELNQVNVAFLLNHEFR